MNEDLSTPESVKELMLSSKSEDDWNNNCDKVKKEFSGYPGWWFNTTILGGVVQKAKALHNWM